MSSISQTCYILHYVEMIKRKKIFMNLLLDLVQGFYLILGLVFLFFCLFVQLNLKFVCGKYKKHLLFVSAEKNILNLLCFSGGTCSLGSSFIIFHQALSINMGLEMDQC